MGATSLAEQLQRLSVPQSTIYKEDKKRASLLFDPKEAALKDRDTFYEIGLSGLQELINLYEGFRHYEDTLFSVSSKDFERAVQTQEVNHNLDQTIEKFLLQLSPYLLLESSHKALEWLVNRYHIHEYNQDAIMALILPYHETKIFIRFVQLMNVMSSSNRWNWLQPIQKPGLPLAKQVLYNQCVSNSATLQFIAKSTRKYVKEFGDRATQLNTVFAFFCSTVIGTMNSSKHITEAIINAVLPTLMATLDSHIADFRSSGYVILGYLTTKANIKEGTLNEIVDKLLTTDFDFSYDMALLINLIYTNQNHITKTFLYNISVNTMNTLCGHFKKLVEAKINVMPFTLAFLSSVLPVIQNDDEEFRRFSELPEILIDEVDLNEQQPENLIRCILNAFGPQKDNVIANGDESDIEIIDEDDFSHKILQWYSVFLKNVERKYPDAFDKIIKAELSNKTSSERRAQITKVLGFNPAVAHKIGGKYLYENLIHINPELRVAAVNYIGKEFETLKKENIDFVKESIINRLKDDNVDVVTAAIAIPAEYLQEILDEVTLSSVFVNIVSKSTKNWKPVIREAVVKFCLLETLPVNHDTVLALVPHLFPYDETSTEIACAIITSPWGNKFELTKNLKGLKKAVKDKKEISSVIFKALFTDKTMIFDDVLDINRLNKSRTLDLSLYLLLKSCSFDRTPIEELIEILNLLIESVENRELVSSSKSKSFSYEIMLELIKCSRQNKIVFDVMEYIFSRIIEEMKIKDITKPWCNVCKTSQSIFVRRLYEIFLTGCSIPTYSQNYTKLLQKLLSKLFSDAREKFEFIANLACGHILYATDPKDVISPELQLRSLKLLNKFVSLKKKSSWIYDSDVLILMILFSLNNPVAVIRQCVIELIYCLLKDAPHENNTYVELLRKLISHKEELLLDHEQIPQILVTVLTEQTPENKTFRKNCLLKLMDILMTDTPPHIFSEFLKILSNLNSTKTFPRIVSSLHALETTLKQGELNKNLIFDIYESKLFKNVYSRINKTTVSTLSKEQIWNSIEIGLKEYRECILEEDETFTSPSVLIMKQIDEDVFKNVPEAKCKELIRLIASAGAFSNNPAISSVASKVMKKIHLNFSDFEPILYGMLNAADPGANISKKNKTSVSMLTYQLTETDEWRIGVTLLENIQSKKKLSVDNTFVSLLFQLLNKCLRFEEQSYVEYTKQLILSSLWYYCKKFVDDKDEYQVKSLKSIFEIELVVQCIRGTQNPQTHHHALILLSHAAYMLPEKVLHHTMEIFTFMGSSVLRHDDAYSFQIIIKIIETLVPILVKLDNTTEEYREKNNQQLHNRVVPVLRIFVDVVLHVPEHRRLPLYKKLIETLGPRQFLWVFLGLLLENYIAHFKENKEKDKSQNRTLADQESPVNRLDFGQSILLEFPPEIGLDSFNKLMHYLKSLPLQKDENAMYTVVNPSDIFSVNGHTPIQLRHYKYVIITFMNTCLSSSRFIHHTTQAGNVKIMGDHYKNLIINILTFIQSITKVGDEKTAKYWRVMLHHSYDLLDHTNNLLSAPVFLTVIRGLMKHTLQTVRRKSMELLNSKIQFSPEMFNELENKNLLFSLLPALLDIVKTVEDKGLQVPKSEVLEKKLEAQEIELNQQTALLSLKLLTRMLASEHPEEFKSVLDTVTAYTCNLEISGNVMASIVLCLAELCANMKAYTLVNLRKFMPALIRVLKKQRKADTPELILLSTVTAISKIVESLPLFLSPYLHKILYEYSILLAKWISGDQECNKVSAIVSKLSNIKKKIASSIPPRVLIPVVNETHQLLLEKENYDAIGPLMSVLADTFANLTTADFTVLREELTKFFLSALQLRSDISDKNVSNDVIDKAEDEVVNALVCLVLKLSENSFRPLYFQIYDWAFRSNIGQKNRSITFYRLISAIADKLKGLFVLFAAHLIKNASQLLDSCNTSKTEELYFDSEEKCLLLITYVIKTIHTVCLYDSQNFLNKDRFETLMQPVVDQLENTLGGIPKLKERAKEVLIPCISQFAVATADDSLWKLLNYQILLKTRHDDAEIRLLALECLVAMATQLGSGWLPLLAESVPFLAELLEDGDSNIEASTKDAIRKLEQILGEPLEKYF